MMTENKLPACGQAYTAEECALVEQIISLEKSALDKFFNGDMSGYRHLWSARSFTYFDAVVTERVESHAAIEGFLDALEGKLHADSYDFRSPRVQLGCDMAVLTYQLSAHTNLNDIRYNCIEVFQKEEDGAWYVIHSTWAVIRPMDMDFSAFRAVVV